MVGPIRLAADDCPRRRGQDSEEDGGHGRQGQSETHEFPPLARPFGASPSVYDSVSGQDSRSSIEPEERNIGGARLGLQPATRSADEGERDAPRLQPCLAAAAGARSPRL